MRRVQHFRSVRSRRETVERLQAWLDKCEADTENEYDIGEPIPFGVGFIVMYNIEPLAKVESLCTSFCGNCGGSVEHHCTACGEGVPVPTA